MLWLLSVPLILFVALVLIQWWTWPVLDEWILRNVTWFDVSAYRASLHMHTSAVRRALVRYNSAHDENVEFLRLVRPPLLLYLRRMTIIRSSTWALVTTKSGERLIFLKGWFTSDSVDPEFFEI